MCLYTFLLRYEIHEYPPLPSEGRQQAQGLQINSQISIYAQPFAYCL